MSKSSWELGLVTLRLDIKLYNILNWCFELMLNLPWTLVGLVIDLTASQVAICSVFAVGDLRTAVLIVLLHVTWPSWVEQLISRLSQRCRLTRKHSRRCPRDVCGVMGAVWLARCMAARRVGQEAFTNARSTKTVRFF